MCGNWRGLTESACVVHLTHMMTYRPAFDLESTRADRHHAFTVPFDPLGEACKR